jgi:lactate permease
VAPLSLRLAWTPYLLAGVLLAVTRIEALRLKGWLQGAALGWPDILGTGISATIQPLYLPGTVFVVVVLATVVLHRMDGASARAALGEALGALRGAAIALAAAVPMVAIFRSSGVNDTGLASMPLELAGLASAGIGEGWPLVAPVIGALGSFVSGSATVSNLMFSLFQYATAEQVGLSATVVLAAQMLGANAGNMICVHNVVAACSVVGALGREGDVIRLTLGPMLLFAALAGVLAFVAA